MKKIAFCFIVISLSIESLQSNTIATVASSTLIVSKSEEAAEVRALLFRLDEINAMDKSNISPFEKKNLRREVLSIKNHIGCLAGGVWISAGALVLILILLIILL